MQSQWHCLRCQDTWDLVSRCQDTQDTASRHQNSQDTASSMTKFLLIKCSALQKLLHFVLDLTCLIAHWMCWYHTLTCLILHWVCCYHTLTCLIPHWMCWCYTRTSVLLCNQWKTENNNGWSIHVKVRDFCLSLLFIVTVCGFAVLIQTEDWLKMFTWRLSWCGHFHSTGCTEEFLMMYPPPGTENMSCMLWWVWYYRNAGFQTHHTKPHSTGHVERVGQPVNMDRWE